MKHRGVNEGQLYQCATVWIVSKAPKSLCLFIQFAFMRTEMTTKVMNHILLLAIQDDDGGCICEIF